MARGPRVHAVARLTEQVGWCPSGESVLGEDETTKKVPEHLVTLAMALEDDLAADVHTQPMCGVGTSTHEALATLQSNELLDAFASIDGLDSEPPSAAYQSGIVPAGTGLPQRVAIPPPPPAPPTAESRAAFEKRLDAFLRNGLYFAADAANEQRAPSAGVTTAVTVTAPRSKPKKVRVRRKKLRVLGYVLPLRSRATVSRTVASSVIAILALFTLLVIGTRPYTITAPSPRRVATAHARAARGGGSTTARAPRTTPPSVIATTPSVPSVPSTVTRRAPAPNRVAKAPGRIVRTLPF